MKRTQKLLCMGLFSKKLNGPPLTGQQPTRPRERACRQRAGLQARRRSRSAEPHRARKDARELGKQAAEIAALLADGKKMSDVPGVTTFSAGPKKVAMKALLLTPVPITKDNLGVVIDAGWIKKAEVCQGVKPGSVRCASESKK